MTLRSAISHPWLVLRLQILLGALFVAAALPKIVDPPAFAQMVHNYRLLPPFAVSALALVLPWLELLCGVALVLGIWKRTAVLMVGAMLFVFIVAISVNLARGNAVNCGCFDVNGAVKTREELFADMRWVVVRDAAMLAGVALLSAAWRRREVAATL